jgi:hypothetical protein
MPHEVDIILDGEGNSIERQFPARAFPRLDLADVIEKLFARQAMNPYCIVAPLLDFLEYRFDDITGR